jgi:hypothetical protein
MPALAGRSSIDSELGCLFQDVRCHGSPRTVALRGRGFGRLRFRFGGGFCGVGFECGKGNGGGLLDHFQTLGEQGGVAMIEGYVVRRISPAAESDGGSDHERNRFGFRLAHGLGGGDAPLGTM